MRIEDEIGQFIITTLNQEGPLLGAKLGARIKFRFPDFNLRAFRNLSTFIATFCGLQVVGSVSKTGLDYVWAVRESPQLRSSPGFAGVAMVAPGASPPLGVVEVAPREGVTSATAGLPGIAVRPASLQNRPPALSPPWKLESAWKAFTHPVAKGRLAVNLGSGDVSLVPEDSPLPEGCVEVAKVTRAEHRGIAAEYIPQLEISDQLKFRTILALDDFWHKWSREMKLCKYGKYAKTWAEFRFSRLCGLFQERVKSLGASDGVVGTSLENLKRLKKKESGISTPSDKPATASSMRRVVLHSIGSLSDEDLRQVWLPVGAIFDALRRG